MTVTVGTNNGLTVNSLVGQALVIVHRPPGVLRQSKQNNKEATKKIKKLQHMYTTHIKTTTKTHKNKNKETPSPSPKKTEIFSKTKTKAVTGNIFHDPHPSHEHTRHMENISSNLNKVTVKIVRISRKKRKANQEHGAKW